ncbi:MAG: S46 family peptidase [Phycisphaerales bacterium]|nr:MAG: S46 family peptidase [Phycisphaerales bacterium]
MWKPARILWCLVGWLALTAAASAQRAPLEQRVVDIGIDSGPIVNLTSERTVVYSTTVSVPESSWLRLVLIGTRLGKAPEGGAPTVLRISSVRDGAAHRLNSTTLRQWQFTSAYMNGDRLLVEVIADPGAAESRVMIPRGWAGPMGTTELSICGPTDDRELSDDPRVGRNYPTGCTSWLIDDANHCNLTAGHCADDGLQVVEFNVPLSNPDGTINHPGPEDQYSVDPVSVQTNGGQGVGDDWAYFGCFPNSNTGLTPYEAQGDYFVLVFPPPADGQDIRITGYGTTSYPVPPEWNKAQKTHVGPYFDFYGTTVMYTTDTTGGNSGSPVIFDDTGEAIGIHTHGGCNDYGGNHGTGANHDGLQYALAHPQGVCIPKPNLLFTYPDGLPDYLNPAGDSIRVEVSGQNEGVPQPGTGVLHYNAGAGFVEVPMNEISDNVYDAIFPAIDCPTLVAYYFSAETTDAEVVTDPVTAPDAFYTAYSAIGIDFGFADDFETDTGWTVENFDLQDGQWERGVPAGGGDRGDPPTDYDGSGACYVTDNADGDSDVDGGPTRLISPTIDLSGLSDPQLSYARWFNNDDQDADRLDVEISNDDGANWTPIESVGHVNGWVVVQLRVADYVTPTATMKLRFSATDNPNDSVTEAGIDAVKFFEFECGVFGDVNGDGVVDIDDIFAVLAAWGPCDDCPEDVNGDGVVDIDDLFEVLANWT